MSTRDERYIAAAVLGGCNPVYYDYGHPERAQARMYWTAECPRASHILHGYTRAEVCRKWLDYMGVKVT